MAIGLAFCSLAAAQTSKPIALTDADYVEFKTPDGDVCQDFTYAGLGASGGIFKAQGKTYDVTKFGASGDDGADDQPAIQKAVDAAIADGGGTVYLPDGVYHLNNTVDIRAGNIVIAGQSRKGTVVKLDNAATGGGFYDAKAAFHFEGARKIDFTNRYLAAAAKRGQTVLQIKDHGYKAGDVILHDEKVFNQLMLVQAVSGQSVTVDTPLRLDLGVADGKFRRYGVIRKVGVHSMTIETTRQLNTNGVNFYGVWQGYARDLLIRKAGRFPVGYNVSRFIEVRDCEFDDAWQKGSGGVGYVGFWACADCLMDNVDVRNIRHGPNLQDGAIGCVIRNSRFVQSDLQWHTGAPTACLIENVRVELDGKKPDLHSAQLLRTSRPGIDTIHSPAGPGNVVWNSDFVAASAKVVGGEFGHEMTDWLFAYNRVVAPGGDTAFMRIWYEHAVRFTLRGNVLVKTDPARRGFVELVSDVGTAPKAASLPASGPATRPADGAGVRFVGNRMFGWQAADGKWWAGAIAPVDESNSLDPKTPEAVPQPKLPQDRDGKPVESLYAWQMKVKYGSTVSAAKPQDKQLLEGQQ
jgi:hypothetical protein